MLAESPGFVVVKPEFPIRRNPWAMDEPDSDAKQGLRVQRNRTMLRDAVLEELRAALMRGRFKPGERLLERDLCEWLGVSRTSVREALRRLESEGFVESVRHKGPVVSSLDARTASQIDEVRAVLFAEAMRRLARNANDRQVAGVKRAFEKLERALAGRDEGKIADAAVGLYFGLIEASGNSVLNEILTTLNARVMFAQSAQGPRAPSEERLNQCVGELRRLVKAIAARDRQAAYDVGAEHVRHGGGAELMVSRRLPPVGGPR